MRIEVLVPGEDLILHDFSKPKLVVGSDEQCDVVIIHPEVSRQHLLLIAEGDNYYVMDRGSTNGTYLNEERLIPGRRVEFNSFFPVRIGKDVLISLLSDQEEVEEEEKISIPFPVSKTPKAKEVNTSNSDATRVISLKALKEAKTETLVKRRTEIKKTAATGKNGKPAAKKKKKSGFKFTSSHAMALAVVLVALYFNNPFEKREVEEVVTTKEVIANENGEAIESDAAKKRKEIQRKERIEAGFLELAPKIIGFQQSAKCVSELEKKVCALLPVTENKEVEWGAKEGEDGIYIYANADTFYQSATESLSYGIKEGQTFSKLMQLKITAAFFLLDGLTVGEDIQDLSGRKLYFALYQTTPSLKLLEVVETTAEEIVRTRVVILRRKIMSIGPASDSQFEFTSSVFRVLFEEN